MQSVSPSPGVVPATLKNTATDRAGPATGLTWGQQVVSVTEESCSVGSGVRLGVGGGRSGSTSLPPRECKRCSRVAKVSLQRGWERAS